MLEQELIIINKLGLHTRASAKLVNIASKFASSVIIECAGQKGDAKSIMSMMMLAASKGSAIIIYTDGEDEQEAMDAVAALINNYFDEDE